MTDILADLNLPQQQAVTFGDGPLLILAGAGSGKTRALTFRAAYLIKERKIPSENILLLTFTNKAAGEMKERIAKILGDKDTKMLGESGKSPHAPISQYPNISPPFAGTFHSFCAKVLRRDGHLLGIPANYVIYDEADQLEAIKEILEKLHLSPKEFKPAAVLNTISQAKNELISKLEYPQYARSPWQKTVAQTYLDYQQLLSHNDAVDFDDLIFKTVVLFKRFPEILGQYQNRYPYLLIDEYQDTNHAQYVFTKLLAQRYRNLTVVGDASQSIYGWRGANFRNLVNLKSDFPNLTIINLEQNYRSTQIILDLAYRVISHNTSHPILKLWTQNQAGERASLYEAQNEIAEAEFIANQIVRLSDRFHLSDFAVLYRTNAQSRVLEEVFLRAGLPYLLVGGTRFYQRKEIKDVLAYLRLIANPKDAVSRKRLEKIGKTRLSKFLDWLKEKQAQKKINLERTDTLVLLDSALKAAEYLELYDLQMEEDLGRLENIKELRSVAAEFPRLQDFLENVALVEQEYLPESPFSSNKKEVITLMTLHASKGLEFPVVFLVGMEEGLFPHSRSLLDRNELEEERRLCYVGLTRAKEKVFLTHTRKRLYFGQRSANEISRFIQDLPEELLETVQEFQ
ncbi:MAG TPA: UvrD-helicase domain-containing protein [Patescibacteria group bacterium]|nr:UvrD-helicase domain-containing protein [Patescibacteria group bacterium]